MIMDSQEAQAFILENLAEQLRRIQSENRQLSDQLEAAERNVHFRKVDRLKARIHEQFLVVLSWEETLEGMRDKIALFRDGQYEKCFSKDAEIQNVIVEYRKLAP